MRGKGRKVLVDALFVADVGEHFIENHDLAFFIAGNEQTVFDHQGKQADSFQKHRLPARVRTPVMMMPW